MGIKYFFDEELQKEINDIAELMFPHVRVDDVVCIP